jgi:Ca-activated chloride channel homolog
MSFTWPLALLGLFLAPVLFALYVWSLRKRKKSAVRFSNVALVRAAMPPHAKWRRHIPPAVFLTGLLGLGVAVGRPQASVNVPIARTSIVMALDVSRSMCATDVLPNRLSVAQEAARAFVNDQPGGTRIGIVAFAGFAELVVPPTTDKKELIAAIDGFVTSRGTAIGSATLASLDAIANLNPDVAPVGSIPDSGSAFDVPPSFSDPTATEAALAPEPGPPAGTSFVPDIVVLLTDGANTRGIDPVTAAKQAVERRVRVYTIGFGTTEPKDMVCTAKQVGGDSIGDGLGGFGGFGGGGGGGGGGRRGFRRFMVTDEPTLKRVAVMTGGAFYKAEDASQLRKVFANLPKQVVLQKRKVEVSVGFVGVGLLLTLTAMVLSLRWNRSP